MIRKLLSLCFIFLISFDITAQDFLGLSTGNYAGVSGVMLQPASIVDSRHKFDINLFSTGLTYDNNYLLVSRDVILKFNRKNFDQYQTFKSKYLSEAALDENEKVYFNVRNRIQLPLSFMTSIGKKSAIALNIQSRSMLQGRDISTQFAKMAYNAFYYPPLNNNEIDASGFSLNTLNWAEIGLTYGRVLYESDKHFFKAAFTGKYLAGIASLNMASNNFRFSINPDSSVNFTTDNFKYQHNENADFKFFDRNDFTPDANAFGWDAGLVYEYRRNIKNFKYIRNDDEKSYLENRRDVNKYILRVGVSLLDAGKFKFDKPANVGSFSGNVTNWNLPNANYNGINEFDTALANRVSLNPNDSRSYNVQLPTALSVQVDLRFIKGFYLNAMLYQPVSMGNDGDERFNKYGVYAITPRWESRHVGVYIPYTIPQKNDFTDYKQNMLGATLRLGPLFIGSSNLGNMLFNKNLRGANVHLGLKIGVTYGKPNKSTQLMDRIFSKKQQAEKDSMYLSSTRLQRYSDSINRYYGFGAEGNRLLVDYSKGQIFESRGEKQNIIIINNNYFGTAPSNMVIADTGMVRTMLVQRNDSIRYRQDSILMLRSRAVSDSTKRIADTLDVKRRQLDSLIRSMQQLRMQMDSARSGDSLNAAYNRNNDYINNDSVIRNKQVPYATNRRLIMEGQQRDTMYISDGKSNVSSSQTGINLSDTIYTDSEFARQERDSLHNVRDTVYKSSTERQGDTILKKKRTTTNTAEQKQKVTTTKDRDTVYIKQSTSPNGNTNNAAALQQQLDYNRLQQQRSQQKQEEMLNAYLRQSNNLQKEINRLQSDLAASNRLYRRNNDDRTVPIVIQPSPQIQQMDPTSRERFADTVYVRDTIRLKDDRLLQDKIAADKPVVESPVAKIDIPVIVDTVVNSNFDYTSIPADVLLFDLGKSAVRPIYYSRLNYLAGILIQHRQLKATITGHTDPTGPLAINQALSQKRAQNVAQYLVKKGVASSQLQVDALAANEPAIQGKSASANSQNRRVEIQLMR
ncbi:MAG: DUF5723 family protein [Bacteroidota bacterium]